MYCARVSLWLVSSIEADLSCVLMYLIMRGVGAQCNNTVLHPWKRVDCTDGHINMAIVKQKKKAGGSSAEHIHHIIDTAATVGGGEPIHAGDGNVGATIVAGSDQSDLNQGAPNVPLEDGVGDANNERSVKASRADKHGEQKNIGAVGLAGFDLVSDCGGIITLPLNGSDSRKDAEGHILCQVDDCPCVMDDEPVYYRRYKVCKAHLKGGSLVVDGEEQRFCQQCGRFHPIGNFDGEKRNCRHRLEKHNRRRRKYLTTKDGSKIRKKGDFDPRYNLLLSPKQFVDDDEEGTLSCDPDDSLDESMQFRKGKDLFNSDGELTAHPLLLVKKIREYYTSNESDHAFYPHFVREIVKTERLLGRRVMQDWLGCLQGDDALHQADGDMPYLSDKAMLLSGFDQSGETLIGAIQQAITLQQAGYMQQQTSAFSPPVSQQPKDQSEGRNPLLAVVGALQHPPNNSRPQIPHMQGYGMNNGPQSVHHHAPNAYGTPPNHMGYNVSSHHDVKDNRYPESNQNETLINLIQMIQKGGANALAGLNEDMVNRITQQLRQS